MRVLLFLIAFVCLWCVNEVSVSKEQEPFPYARRGGERNSMIAKRIREEDYERLRGGMTLVEVEAIFGWPGERKCPVISPSRPCPSEVDERFWYDGDVIINVVFSVQNGRAQAWGWQKNAPPLPPGTPVPPPKVEW